MKSKSTARKQKSNARRASANRNPTKSRSAGVSPTRHGAPAKGSVAPTQTQRDSKQARLIAKLGDPSGTTIQQMMALTGWQAHTVRGTISGVLRKKLGLNVTCDASPKSGERIYRIAASAASA